MENNSTQNKAVCTNVIPLAPKSDNLDYNP